MKKIILLIFPLLLISCGGAPSSEKEETQNIAPPSMSNEAEKIPEKNPSTKPHRAQLSTAKPETKEVTKELDAVFEEIANGK